MKFICFYTFLSKNITSTDNLLAVGATFRTYIIIELLHRPTTVLGLRGKLKQSEKEADRNILYLVTHH